MRIALKTITIAILVLLYGSLSWADEGDLGWSTFLGGSGDDQGYGIAVDGAGAVYLTGAVASVDFPSDTGAVNPPQGGRDLLVAKLNAAGDSLIYVTLLGGSEDDEGRDIQVDSRGFVYLAGVTNSTDFPVTQWAMDTTYNGSGDIVAVRLDRSGSQLYYSTYLGTAGADWGQALALDEDKTVCLTGYTDSPDFPTTPGAFDSSYNGGHWDAFVVRLSEHADFLEYATFLGGEESDTGQDVVLDGQGRMIVAGNTASADFPVTGAALDIVHNGGLDIFVAQFETQGEWLSSATYLGGGLADYTHAMAVDSSGSIYLAGRTFSDDFPITPISYDDTYDGSYAAEAFVAKLGPEVKTLEFSTFLGGTGTDECHAIALDDGKNVYVTGRTHSEDFPSTPGSYSPTHSGAYFDAFLVGLDSTGSQLIYGTFLGGAGIDLGSGLAVDRDGAIYITGETESADYPVTPGALCDTLTGGTDIFVTKLNLFGTPVEFEDPSAGVPGRFALHQNYPNPFNARTEIRYQIPVYGHVNLKVYNILGAHVATLVDKDQKSGSYRINWDAKDVASGIYFCRLQVGEFVGMVKMVLLR